LIPSLFIPPFKVPSIKLVVQYKNKDKSTIKYCKKGYIVTLLVVHMKSSLRNFRQYKLFPIPSLHLMKQTST